MTDKSFLNTACEDFACRDQLNDSDKLSYMICFNKVKVMVGTVSPIDDGCHFFLTKHRKPVALISYPGSGNTWVRQLLEAATGICTGSVMCDMSLRLNGFTGENLNSGSVLVVKTHALVPTWVNESTSSTSHVRSSRDLPYESAIFLLRNPMDALVSEWNRIVANGFKSKTVNVDAHTQKAAKENFSELK